MTPPAESIQREVKVYAENKERKLKARIFLIYIIQDLGIDLLAIIGIE